jgi:plastocyanin
MKGTLALLATIVAALNLTATAGTISGMISGVEGESVVYVGGVAGKKFSAPSEKPVINQKNLMFQPHLTAIQQGTTVEFVNGDKVAHTVFWPSIGGNKRLAHNLGSWPQGQSRTFKFDNPGAVPLLCNVHLDMSGYLIVSPTPYFTITDKSGAYKIENVPDGHYNVTAWHEGGKNQNKPVNVAGETRADFSLGK